MKKSERQAVSYGEQIKLDEKSAQEFVSAASRCNFDIDVFYNRIIIDAKSILGLLSLDLTKTLTVKCYGEDEDFKSCSFQVCSRLRNMNKEKR